MNFITYSATERIIIRSSLRRFKRNIVGNNRKLFIGLVNNGLILAGLDVSQQQVIRGAIIIAAVALSRKK